MLEDLRSIHQFAEENPAFTESAVRWQIFNAKNNGLEESGAIVRIRRRVYLDTKKYTKWIENQQSAA